MRILLAAAMAVTMSGAASAASAAVKSAAEGRLELESTAIVNASPQKVYEAIGQIGSWWDPAHSYGGKMTLELKPGGCFCEATAGGGVKHGEVVMAMPGQFVRLSAPLGPMQDWGVSAAITFALTPAEGGGTRVVLSYKASGFSAGQLQAAPGIDAVVGGQLTRLKAFVETGKPT
ncbi:MAG: SRPBCC domain-containing protein [Caulobacter sp.]|nr:SRPBCC domain-containing protein [Caulobacter sp.]